MRGVGQGHGHAIGGVFQVRQIDIDDAFQLLKRVHFIVGVGVVDDGQRQSLGHRLVDGAHDLRYVLGGGYQVDVVAVKIILHVEHAVGQACRCDLIGALPLRILGDLEILAEGAAQVAVAEEDGAGALIA